MYTKQNRFQIQLIIAVKGERQMLNDEICKVRNKLNKSIEEEKDYEEIYKISVELDELIAKFYSKKIGNKIKNCK